MGNGAWNDNTYRAAATFRRARGIDDFGYSAELFDRPRDQWRADRTMDPFGVPVRESRDSAEHPNSTPIAVLFDVTGSMGRVPLQVGQFESDNRMDDQLRTIFLEGNGGGQKSESYELATYFIARHTVTDAWEK